MLNLKQIVFILCLAFLSFTSAAQNIKRCSTTEYLKYQIEKDPSLKLKIEKAQEALKISQLEKNNYKTKSANAVITIPVVVHVVYNIAADNISLNQIQSQLNVLNEDFRMNNADSGQTPAMFQAVAADAEIEFCLAVQDPDGNFTNGITRTQTSVTAFNNTNEAIKSNSTGGKTGWDRNRYLNIWVGPLIPGVLGYSSLIGQSASVDGVVVGTRFFGKGSQYNLESPYNLGRTATHEIGHWLNLKHIWGISRSCDYDDDVADTPNSDTSYYACNPMQSFSCGSQDMYMNFMDYVPDACMHLFTAGQKARMVSAINTYRSSILSSEGCTNNALAFDAAINVQSESVITCENFYPIEIMIINEGLTTITNLQVQYAINGNPPATANIDVNLTQGQSTLFTIGNILVLASNQITIEVISVNGVADQNNDNNIVFHTIAKPVDSETPLIEGFESDNLLELGWHIQNPNDDEFHWQHNTLYGDASNSSVVFENYSGEQNNNPNGTVDHLISPAIDFANATYATLSFSKAYAIYSQDFIDGLRISSSIDCGETWQTLFYAEGTTLATITDSFSGSPYLPNNDDWQTHALNLNSLIGNNDVQFRFTNESGWGQNLWLDNININTDAFTGIEDNENLNAAFSVYPNPTNDGAINVHFPIKQLTKAIIEIYNANGKLIKQLQLNNTTTATLNLNKQANGLYLVKLIADDFQLTKKVLLSK